MSEHLEETEIFQGNHWCNYCKEPIVEGNDIVSKNGKLYHLECWSLIIDYREELDFIEHNFSDIEDLHE